MKHTLDSGQMVDVGLALQTIKEMCESTTVCETCPLIVFCAVNNRLDPWQWNDADIPESLIVKKK